MAMYPTIPGDPARTAIDGIWFGNSIRSVQMA
jgi:hypothetical protein